MDKVKKMLIKHASHKWSKRFISAVLVIAGLSWICFILIGALDEIDNFVPDNYLGLAAASFLVGLSMLVNWYIFHSFLVPKGNTKIKFHVSLKLFINGGLLRYLPGRIWGIIYQINEMRDIVPAGNIARANINYMAFTLLGSLVFGPLIIFFYSGYNNLYLLLISLLFFMTQLVIFLGGADRILLFFANKLTGRISRLLIALIGSKLNLQKLMHVYVAYGFMWLLYCYGLTLIPYSFEAYDGINFVFVAAAYTLSATLGILSIVTPAGLGVREASFTYLASASVGLEFAAIFAVFARVWFLLIEFGIFIVVNASLLLYRFKKQT